MKSRGLGKGLSELFGEVVNTQSASDANQVKYLNLNNIIANKNQPRQQFDEKAIFELSESIKRNGVLQPLIVRLEKEGHYSIIAGERRFRASKSAGLREIPCIVRDVSENEVMELALVENIQREDLNVMEEAESYQKLMIEFGYTQEELANILGKSRPHVANIIRLNSLPPSVKEKLAAKSLSMGHVKTLIGHEDAEEIASVILYKNLNSRQAEQLIKNWNKKTESEVEPTKNSMKGTSEEDLQALVDALSEKFGMNVTIKSSASGGQITFHYSSLEQLDSILSNLTSMN